MSSSLTSSLEAAFKLPVISAPGSFDGSSDATRWLTKLQWSFQAVNEGRDADPNTFIKAMNMALEGQAATYVDSSELLRSIVSRASHGSATQDDLADFRRALTDRYHPNFVDEPALTSSNFEMRQGADEPLFAYHTRVVGLLRRAGGKDAPSGDDTPLSIAEKYILNVLSNRKRGVIPRWCILSASSDRGSRS
ncbi:hypothetical protein E4U09_008065 [Claviceps aff. purpurea]|uniref:Retrotransposon gag domain-containing protein n=1 Tax=Claviceps aff. purpurea TaxID=1967640 RepID=A0A9P7Q9S4_9HYPO|nr:hypothetical protein E4U09_008065 [Claviceps aff. purpurea]